MAKIYSPLLILCALFSSALYAQNVGVGTSNPQEKLDVQGAIKIGTTTGNYAGTIRYNPTSNKFEGRDSISWKEFGTGGEDDWTKVSEAPVANDGADIYHTGNVGIGTAIPLTKLHVKGSGAVAIRAETSNGSATIPAVYAINTIGIAMRAETSSDTMPAIWAKSDSSFAIRAETQSSQWPAIRAYNKDSTGYALEVINKDAEGGMEGGNAALFMGDVNMLGAIRNTAALYGGSVAVNDGLTVGSISGATCLTVIPETKDFSTTIPSFTFFSGTSATYAHNIDSTQFTGECRAITGFSLESTFFDYDVFPINVELFVRNQYIGAILEPKANLNLDLPLPSNPPLVDLWEEDGGWYSSWIHSIPPNHPWIGTDPANTNWFVHAVNYGADTDCWVSFNGLISYNWGDYTSSPYYAAFGEVRASGKLYANSISEYGDVAEYFKVDKKLRLPEPGDVVSISKDNAQTFVLSTSANDPLLAGVISENPSLLVNRPDAGQQPIALTGRVKVKVNLEGGKISTGDAITSSSVEGIGMKAKGEGMILGHALEAFDGARTDEGKIWILISRTQIAPPSGVKIVQGQDFNLGGVMVSGAQKVAKNERTVFVQWDKKTNGKIPADVEFDDLVIDLTPFGDKADLVITAVSAEGFEVKIGSRGQDFEGFYYKAEIVSTEMYQAPQEQNMTHEERVANAQSVYQQWNATAEKLMSLSGKSLKDMPAGMGPEQIKKFKESVIKSWEKADAGLYAQYLLLQDQLGAAIGNDASVMRQAKGAN